MIARTPWTGLIAVAVVGGAATLLHLLPRLAPAGLPSEGIGVHEGLLYVPREGIDLATFNSRDLLIDNENSRALGRQRVSVTCLLPEAEAPAFAAALAQTRPGRDGERYLWVRMSAETRFATGPCQQYHQSGSRQHWGTYLRVAKLERATQLRCEYLTFVLRNRRCKASDQPL